MSLSHLYLNKPTSHMCKFQNPDVAAGCMPESWLPTGYKNLATLGYIFFLS
jgi:hypothetical protein